MKGSDSFVSGPGGFEGFRTEIGCDLARGERDLYAFYVKRSM